MSKRAEDLAKQLYPDPKLENYDDILIYRADRDNAIMGRLNVIRVYEQAEKDLADKAKFSSGMDGFYYGHGYRDGKKDTIERAVKWLQEHSKEYIVNIGIDDSQELVVGGMCWVYLKQALEGEENE